MRQYVGARYVPKFYQNPNGTNEWSANTSYEALTVVQYNNASYTSKKPVTPTVGNPAENGEYWALTGNYNGQFEDFKRDFNSAIDSVNKSETDFYNKITAENSLFKNNIQNEFNTFTEENNTQLLNAISELNDTVANYESDFAIPLFVDDLNQMIDNNKIYVLKTDGMIYYYNGNTFTSTGIVYGAYDKTGVHAVEQMINGSTTDFAPFVRAGKSTNTFNFGDATFNSVISLNTPNADLLYGYPSELNGYNLSGTLVTLSGFTSIEDNRQFQLFSSYVYNTLWFRNYRDGVWGAWFNLKPSSFNGVHAVEQMINGSTTDFAPFVRAGKSTNTFNFGDATFNSVISLNTPNADLLYGYPSELNGYNLSGTLVTLSGFTSIEDNRQFQLFSSYVYNTLWFRNYRDGVWGAWFNLKPSSFNGVAPIGTITDNTTDFSQFSDGLNNVFNFNDAKRNKIIQVNTSNTSKLLNYPPALTSYNPAGTLITICGDTEFTNSREYQLYNSYVYNALWFREFRGDAWGNWFQLNQKEEPPSFLSCSFTPKIFGDSMSIGQTSNFLNNKTYINKKYSWGYQLFKKYGVTPDIVGRGGISTQQFLTEYTDEINDVAQNDCIFVALGYNQGDVTNIGNVDDIVDTYNETPTNTFIGYYSKLLKTISHNNNNNSIKFAVSVYDKERNDINDAIQLVCSQLDDWFYIDVVNSRFISRAYTHDGIHPSSYGYSCWAIAVEDCINNLLMTDDTLARYFNSISM